VALIDRPYLQRRDPLLLDLSGAAGHLALVGGPRAGKSTALLTSVLALALAHTPDELGVHVLDFGGGALAPLAGLPHVGTVADRLAPELVRRTVAEVTGLLAHRERLFREHAVPSVDDFRARRRSGGFAGEAATDVLLVVDGHPTLRAEFEDLEQRLLQIAGRGLALGVHVALSTGRWSDLRPALRDLCGTRLELRLGEAGDSEVDRRRAAAVPARPGHGLAPDGAPMVFAAPRLGDTCPDAAPRRHGRARRGGRGGLVRTGLPAGAAPARPARPRPAARGAARHHRDPRWASTRSGSTWSRWTRPPSPTCCASPTRRAARPRCCGCSPAASSTPTAPTRRAWSSSTTAGPCSARCPRATCSPVRARRRRRRRRCARSRPRCGAGCPGPPSPPASSGSAAGGPVRRCSCSSTTTTSWPRHPGPGPPTPCCRCWSSCPRPRTWGCTWSWRAAAAARAAPCSNPVLGRLRELAVPTLLMSGSPDEGVLVASLRPSPQPPGRGTLVDRRHGARRVQLAWLPPEPDPA
jgi:S-DNA-T family DNA segregation ATPase FtsK/SpoIIIE